MAGVELEQHWFLVRSRGGEEGSAVDELWNLAASPDGRKLLQGLGLKAPQESAGRLDRDRLAATPRLASDDTRR